MKYFLSLLSGAILPVLAIFIISQMPYAGLFIIPAMGFVLVFNISSILILKHYLKNNYSLWVGLSALLVVICAIILYGLYIFTLYSI